MAGAGLFVLLVAGVILTGQIINRRARQMSDRVVTQISESHHLLLQAELSRTEKVLEASVHFLRTHGKPSEAELRVLTATLLDVDAKAAGIWFAKAGSPTIRRYSRTEEPRSEKIRSSTRMQLCNQVACDSVLSRVISEAGADIWVLCCAVRNPEGKSLICGIDYPLTTLYAYMTEQNPHSRSSAMLLDPEGVIVFHPDSLKLGEVISEPSEIEAFRSVAESGQRLISNTLSDYLGIEEQRIYYPVHLAGERWIAGIGIPRLVIEQEIDDFHLYTILTAVISVLLFAVLLILAQRRWRREYALRRLSEQESAQLQLQQVLDQIDPHFLFNSLNSLYALIRCNPEQAREFTLTLSRVYRRVLERRKQILATLAEEIDFTWQYHSLQQIRFAESLELTTAIDPALRNRRIPAMSLQTLLENAIKHNSISTRNPLHVDIRTEGDSLLIENNRTPRDNDNDESLGVGLERIRSVYRFYTDRNIEISSDERHFRCRLPLLPEDE